MTDAMTASVDRTGDIEHPNLAAVIRAGELIAGGFSEPDAGLFADEFVFHYYNRHRPELAGDYHGLRGIRSFFGRLQGSSGGSIRVEPISATAFGDELVAAYATVTLTVAGNELEIDSLVVWRVFNGQIHEAWDIPAVNTVRARAGGK